MAKGDINEASKATGISVKKLKSSEELTPAEEAIFQDWRAQVAIPDSWAGVTERLNAPNSRWVEISESVGVPYDVVAKIGELSAIISAASFSTNGPFASDLNWPEARDPKKGSAPLYYLVKAIERLEEVLARIYWPDEGRSASAQAMDYFSPKDMDREELRMLLAKFRNTAYTAREFRILEKKPTLPDWVREAARYMIDLKDYSKEQFQAIVQAIEPKLDTDEYENLATTIWDAEAADTRDHTGKDPLQVLRDYHEGLARKKE